MMLILIVDIMSMIVWQGCVIFTVWSLNETFLQFFWHAVTGSGIIVDGVFQQTMQFI